MSVFLLLFFYNLKYADKNKIVTIGIEPTFPEIGFGYIEKGNEIFSSKTINAHQIKSFKEKPVLKKAKTFFKYKRFLRN